MNNNYFSHDFGARNDPKLIELQMDMGGQGLAIWWCLVEMLWEQNGFLPMNYRAIAFTLRWATEDEVRKVVEEFGLFENNSEKFWSNSALERISVRDAVTESKREAGRKGAAVTNSKKKSAVPEIENGSAAAVPEIENGTPSAIKEINKIKEIKESYSSCAHTREGEEEKQKCFIKFFFDKNFLDPVGELKRFWNYYEARGWMWGETRIVDKLAVADEWKPDLPGERFDSFALEWIRGVFDAAVDSGVSWSPMEFLKNIIKAESDKNGFDIVLHMTTKKGAQTVADFVAREKLDANLKVNYRYKK